MALKAWLVGCFAFLYAPILFLVVFSFNDARLVTQWAGFSTCWDATLWNDGPMIEFALLSLRVAAIGHPGLRARGRRRVRARPVWRFPLPVAIRGRPGETLVMPEVITGLALLLLFVAMQQTIGWPQGRGAGTVTLAHASVSMAYVAVVVRARLADAGDMLEQAAMDLYAPPWKTFLLVTLPLMTPALVSGWLLAFTLSMDDVVVASFTSGRALQRCRWWCSR